MTDIDLSPMHWYARQTMTTEQARRYVQQWTETGRLLEQQRWHELSSLSPVRALEAADALIEAALGVPLPESRRRSSGLVDQQRIFQRKRE